MHRGPSKSYPVDRNQFTLNGPDPLASHYVHQSVANVLCPISEDFDESVARLKMLPLQIPENVCIESLQLTLQALMSSLLILLLVIQLSIFHGWRHYS